MMRPIPQAVGLSVNANNATKGGGIRLSDGASLVVDGGVLEMSDNYASSNGGAIRLDESTVTVEAGSLQNNRSAGRGGASMWECRKFCVPLSA